MPAKRFRRFKIPGSALKLSIITINLNNGAGLRETLRSVVSQGDFTNCEHIVVDGASTDSTPEVIAEFRSHIAKLVAEPDSGVYNAMNKGIALAEGDYLLFLNSGDVLVPGVLGKVDFGSFHEDIIYGDLDFQDPGRTRHKDFPPPQDITPAFFLFNTLPHPATFIRRTLFDQYGPYDETMKIAADSKFFFTVVKSGGATLRKLPLTISIFKTDGISSNPKFAALCREECRSYLRPVFGGEVFRREDLLIERSRKLNECSRALNERNTAIAKYRTLVRDGTFAAAMADGDLAEDILRMGDLMLAVRKNGIGKRIIRALSKALASREKKALEKAH